MTTDTLKTVSPRPSSSLPQKQGDRFIPNRSAMNSNVSHYNLVTTVPTGENVLSGGTFASQYNTSLAKSLFGEDVTNLKILALKNKAPSPDPTYQNHLRVLYSQNVAQRRTGNFIISPEAYVTLDAPELAPDYYLNLLDWSRDNVIAIALGSKVFLWEGATGTPCELADFEHISVTSISFCPTKPNYLAVGLIDNHVQVWDRERSVPVRKLDGHQGRVTSLSWNGSILSSGSYDSTIRNWDVRLRNPHVSSFLGHSQDVCGLRWSFDGKQLASGGNDDLVNIWQLGQESPQFSFQEHQAAAKALAWCPWQSCLLATGGGSADRTIKLWNTTTGSLLNSVDAQSQVCALQWSVHRKELVSAHGYATNQICVWKYPAMTKTAELNGHTERVLYMAQSPDGTTVATAAADETLKLWRLYDPADLDKKKPTPSSSSKLSNSSRSIRSCMNKIR